MEALGRECRLELGDADGAVVVDVGRGERRLDARVGAHRLEHVGQLVAVECGILVQVEQLERLGQNLLLLAAHHLCVLLRARGQRLDARHPVDVADHRLETARLLGRQLRVGVVARDEDVVRVVQRLDDAGAEEGLVVHHAQLGRGHEAVRLARGGLAEKQRRPRNHLLAITARVSVAVGGGKRHGLQLRLDGGHRRLILLSLDKLGMRLRERLHVLRQRLRLGDHIGKREVHPVPEDRHRRSQMLLLLLRPEPTLAVKHTHECTFPVHVTHLLLAEEIELQRLRSHRLRTQDAGVCDARRRRIRRRHRGRLHQRVHSARATAPRNVPLHLREHLRRHQNAQQLALANAAHPVGSLRVVTKSHVLGQGERGACRRGLLDVHTGRVHLVVEAEAPVGRQPRLRLGHHRAALAQQHHLAVLSVEKDDAVGVRQAELKERRRHLQV
eukprot:6207995-Pleurochrysis_carterae.AAC.1